MERPMPGGGAKADGGRGRNPSRVKAVLRYKDIRIVIITAGFLDKRRMRGEGISSIFVTHNLLHVYSIADRFTILSHGEKVGDFSKKDISMEELERLIVKGRADAR